MKYINLIRKNIEGDLMGNEIKIQKNTSILLVGLLLAIVFGGYLVFGATHANTQSTGVTVQPPSTIGNQPSGGIQEVYLKATAYGYDKNEIIVKKGIPVKFHFTAQNAGCGSYMQIRGLNVHAQSRNGQEDIIEFTPQQEGTYQYTCGMGMFPPGNFIVTA